ncbi:scarecrow-like protein 6, partial [Asparagus officinalis]|uniref:scarecrow-like protein 6 n=1 Tax=Asparagus officinalis TaxID=4686 RepID=UPI00098E1052
ATSDVPVTSLSFHPNPKRHHSISPITHQHHHHQTIVDHLLKASEFIDAGDPFSAREILARLNQLLPLSPLGLKPLLRSAFIFKDVLNVLLTSNQPSVPATPADVVLKLGSYKAFSEVSPLIHFANFTCTQTLLEEVGAFDRIHIVDFDIGVGGHWSSFIQELAHRRPNAVPFLKITAFVSVAAFHPLELHLTRENLSHFAAELNVPFEFSLIAVESFNPNELLAVSTPNEAIAVNLPFGSHYPQPFPALIKLVKQLNPKVVVSVDQGCDRGDDLPFAHHLLHAFQACTVLLDSIDAAGTNADVANKIERFIVQPRAEWAALGRHRAAGVTGPWRAMFGSAGFVPWQFSNFTETQADCLLKRVQVRGFHVEKRQGSLFLYWQRGELGSVSSWKC